MKIIYNKKTNRILMALKNDGVVSGVHVEYDVIYVPDNIKIHDGEQYKKIYDLDVSSEYIEQYTATIKLQQTDHNMSRVTEDIIDTLIRKGFIDMEDLPENAQIKIKTRQEYRDQLKE